MSYWMIENKGRYEIPCWWDGRTPNSFTMDAQEAVQFRRREDGERIKAWHLKNDALVVTEHEDAS